VVKEDAAEDDRDQDVIDRIFTAGLVLRSATTLIRNRRQIMSHELWPSWITPSATSGKLHSAASLAAKGIQDFRLWLDAVPPPMLERWVNPCLISRLRRLCRWH
jgi:hypothetical protein